MVAVKATGVPTATSARSPSRPYPVDLPSFSDSRTQLMAHSSLLVLAIAITAALLPVAQSDDRGAIATMDELRFNPPGEKAGAGLVPGKVGQAVRFHWENDSPSQ